MRCQPISDQFQTLKFLRFTSEPRLRVQGFPPQCVTFLIPLSSLTSFYFTFLCFLFVSLRTQTCSAHDLLLALTQRPLLVGFRGPRGVSEIKFNPNISLIWISCLHLPVAHSFIPFYFSEGAGLFTHNLFQEIVYGAGDQTRHARMQSKHINPCISSPRTLISYPFSIFKHKVN